MSRRTKFPPDEVEKDIPDVATAELLLNERDPSFLGYVRQRRGAFERQFGDGYGTFLDCAERALKISYARFAIRHGTWGEDLHHYHNERHAVEILSDRLDYLCERAGADALEATDWVLLTLFGAMHDLRQRETPDPSQLIGANERATIEETQRILETSGFDPKRDEMVFEIMRLMIAGSTFNTQPSKAPQLSPAEAATTAGALAPVLATQLKNEQPGWESDAKLSRQIKLMLIASDLDTANVAEPVIKYAQSAVRLCREIEYRCGRDLGTESALPVFNFLTKGQEAYFFDLHQFDSEIGTQVLGAMKERNAGLIRQLTSHVRETFGEAPGDDVTGSEIIDEFMHKASQISGRAARM
ncbi:MAG: hypothetical protein AAGE01_15265 [Pseudomonadota bacterium]